MFARVTVELQYDQENAADQARVEHFLKAIGGPETPPIVRTIIGANSMEDSILDAAEQALEHAQGKRPLKTTRVSKRTIVGTGGVEVAPSPPTQVSEPQTPPAAPVPAEVTALVLVPNDTLRTAVEQYALTPGIGVEGAVAKINAFGFKDLQSIPVNRRQAFIDTLK